MCTVFSTWQGISNKIGSPVTVAVELRRAKEHFEFCVELYREQAKAGRYFVQEHPAYASSWQTDLQPVHVRMRGRRGFSGQDAYELHGQCSRARARAE